MSEILSVAIGGVIAGSVSLFGQWLLYKHTERKLIVEFALKSALDQWKTVSEKADVLKMARHSFGLNTIDGYIIRWFALAQMLTETKMRPSDVAEAISNIEKIGDMINRKLQCIPKQADDRVSDDKSKPAGTGRAVDPEREVAP